jgi:hypothetical protein
MHTQIARTGRAAYRPPIDEKKPGCGNIRAFGNTSEQRKHIKLPKRAQIQLRYLKRRLIAGYGASRYTLEFVRECFMEFPALVKA